MKMKSPKPVAKTFGKRANVSGRSFVPPAYGIDFVDKQNNSNGAAQKHGRVKLTASASRPIQMYKERGTWKISDNNVYKVDSTVSSELHVLQGYAGPEPAAQFTLIRTSGLYDVYTFTGIFVNDCLNFAEYLSTGKYSKTSAFRAKDDKSKGKERLFGISDKQNLSIASPGSSFSKGKEAEPDIGEAFAVVRQREEVDECPYHIAMTVASDGTDRVTCEADAGSQLGAPVFDIYSVASKKRKVGAAVSSAKKGKTFDESYAKAYTTAAPKIPPVVGVLTPRVDVVI